MTTNTPDPSIPPDKHGKPQHYYKVTRVVREVYQVIARDKDEARLMIQNPNEVTVIKETITKSK
jgi:hypothetical protein